MSVQDITTPESVEERRAVGPSRIALLEEREALFRRLRELLEERSQIKRKLRALEVLLEGAE